VIAHISLNPDRHARLYDAWQTRIAICIHASGFLDDQALGYLPNAPFEDLVNPLDRRNATAMGYHPLPAEQGEVAFCPTALALR
jgi:hypothetical protein